MAAGKTHLLTWSRPSGTQSGTAAKTVDEPPQDPGTEAERGSAEPGRHARSRFRAHRARSTEHTHTHTGTRTHTNRQKEGTTQRVRARERRENGRDRDTGSHAAAAQKHTPSPRRQPLTLQASAPGLKAPRGREQPTDTRADLSWRSRGQDFWGDSPQRRPGRPEAGTTRRFPRTPPPAVLSSWPAPCD